MQPLNKLQHVNVLKLMFSLTDCVLFSTVSCQIGQLLPHWWHCGVRNNCWKVRLSFVNEGTLVMPFPIRYNNANRWLRDPVVSRLKKCLYIIAHDEALI